MQALSGYQSSSLIRKTIGPERGDSGRAHWCYVPQSRHLHPPEQDGIAVVVRCRAECVPSPYHPRDTRLAITFTVATVVARREMYECELITADIVWAGPRGWNGPKPMVFWLHDGDASAPPHPSGMRWSISTTMIRREHTSIGSILCSGQCSRSSAKVAAYVFVCGGHFLGSTLRIQVALLHNPKL